MKMLCLARDYLLEGSFGFNVLLRNVFTINLVFFGLFKALVLIHCIEFNDSFANLRNLQLRRNEFAIRVSRLYVMFACTDIKFKR